MAVKKKAPRKTAKRGYHAAASVGGGANNDWPLSMIGEDADIWQNAWALRSRIRDLARTNPTFQSYRETFWANVYGSTGIMLRSAVKETEDRVVQNPEEKAAIRAWEDRQNRVREWAASTTGLEFKERVLLHHFGTNGHRVAQVKVGDPDIFARLLIERRWAEWQLARYADARGTRDYHTIRQLRGWSAVRDGDFFIRLIRDPKVNKFGFAVQLINSEWCDWFLNAILPNGNVIRMGIEYGFSETTGVGKPVAYHFIKRRPSDWQFSAVGMFSNMAAGFHDRIDAREIIHVARPMDADSTRPAPWVASVIGKARQLDQYELAEVIAARQQAMKTGWLYSDVNPEGGMSGQIIDPKTGVPTQALAPGDLVGLPWGVKYQSNDPTHPNQNAESFRKMMMRAQCAGMPGSSYPTMAHDYEAVNFSAGRLAKLDSNELFKMIQVWDINTCERPIFEAWLEMALITQNIPLPLKKFEKFKAAKFQGRRWAGVDEIKEVEAAALRVQNGFSSDQIECADMGRDFEDVAFEQAEANYIKATLGLPIDKTVAKAPTEPDADEEDAPAKPKKSKALVRK